MDSISLEITEKIFSYLNYSERIKCRSVSRKINYAIENLLKFKSSNLIIFTKEFTYEKEWFYTGDPINYNESLRVLTHSRFDFQTKILKFENLKKLKIFTAYYDDSLINVEKINKFQKLEHLELQKLDSLSFELNLPTLKYLFIAEITPKNDFKLNLPKLISFKTYADLSRFTFLQQPTNLIWLQTCWIINTDLNKLANFKNLEYLYCLRVHELKNDAFLEALPNLKEMVFYIGQNEKQRLDEQKERFNRYELKIYYLNSFARIAQDHRFPHRINNRPSLALDGPSYPNLRERYNALPNYLPFIYTLDYNYLASSFREIPDTFYSKFPIRKVIVRNKIISDEMQMEFFFNFLSDLKALESLEFHQSHEQSRFLDWDQLPRCCPFLTELAIHEINLPINFNFLPQLKNIKKLYIEENINEIQLQEVKNILQNLKCLTRFIFKLRRSSRLTICIESQYDYYMVKASSATYNVTHKKFRFK